MDINCYALEVLAKSRLADLRADAARYAGLASVGMGGAGFRGALGSALRYATMMCSRVRMERMGPEERKLAPSARTRA